MEQQNRTRICTLHRGRTAKNTKKNSRVQIRVTNILAGSGQIRVINLLIGSGQIRATNLLAGSESGLE
jgi:hypothetical protein